MAAVSGVHGAFTLGGEAAGAGSGWTPCPSADYTLPCICLVDLPEPTAAQQKPGTTLMTTPPFDAEDDEHDSAGAALRHAAARRSTWVSVGINIGLASLQVMVGVAARSQGLIADGIHSLADLVSDGIVLLATQHSRKDADARHPYGHHRFETAASLALGVLLVMVGGGMIWSAVGKLEHPDAIAPVDSVALWVALAALIAKEALFRYMLAVAQRVKSSLLVANAWHARSDAASSLVVGVGVIGNLMGFRILDPIAAVIVGAMILKMGGGFSWDALHDLVDQSADDAEVTAIAATLAATDGVRDVHDLRTRKMGDMILVDVHISVDADLTVERGHDIAVAARLSVMARHRVLNVMTHIDPWRLPVAPSRE
jgi:cation diffusion facilitator family transporter